MTIPDTHTDVLPERPKRADARRNEEKLIAAAREAFAEGGTAASLEDIARRAHVGIGTLYRHFPTRQALLEAVYIDEVEAICRSAEDFAGLEPWDALVGWLHRFVSFAATKRALFDELLPYIGPDAEVFKSCSVAIRATGDGLLQRAQEAGRHDQREHAARDPEPELAPPPAALGDFLVLVLDAGVLADAEREEIYFEAYEFSCELIACFLGRQVQRRFRSMHLNSFIESVCGA